MAYYMPGAGWYTIPVQQSQQPALKSDVQEKLETEITCQVCLDVPRQGDLYQCTRGHHICLPCYEKLAKKEDPYAYEYPVRHRFGHLRYPEDDIQCTAIKCPTCRGSYILVDGKPQKSLMASNLLETISLKCRNVTNGCNQDLIRKSLLAHEAACGFAQVDCDNKALGCQHKCLKKDKEQHVNDCPHRMVLCRNSAYGCKHQCKLSEEPVHVANSCDRHVIAMQFEEMRKELYSMRQEMESMKCKLG